MLKAYIAQRPRRHETRKCRHLEYFDVALSYAKKHCRYIAGRRGELFSPMADDDA